MHWRWLFGNFADPQYDLTPTEQRELSDLAHERYMPGRRLVLWTVVGIVAPLLLMYKFLPPMLRGLGFSGPVLVHGITFGLVTAVSWPLAAWIYGHAYERAVRMAMRQKGYDVCVACGYLLRDLPGDVTRCPECGAAREPGDRDASGL